MRPEQENELLLNVAADPDGDLLTYAAAVQDDELALPKVWPMVALVLGVIAIIWLLVR